MTAFEKAARSHISSRGSAGTRKLYIDDLVRWLAHCRKAGADANEPTLDDAVEHRDALAKKYKEQTVRRILSALSSMYQAAGIADPFNGKRLERPPPDAVSLTRDFTSVQAEALIAEALKAGSLRDAAILQVLYEVGLRITPVVEMKRSQLFTRDGILVLVTKVKKKGRVEAELPPKSAERLNAWLAVAPKSEWVFPDEDDAVEHLERFVINRRMQTYGRKCGIEKAHPHRFRSTFATQLRNAGVPLEDIQAAMHLADASTVQRYDRGMRGSGVTSALAKYREGQK